MSGILILGEFLSIKVEFLLDSGINSDYFFIGSYTNNLQSGEFLTNSKAGSSYSPNLG